MNGKVHVAIGTATAIGLCVACPEGVDFCGMHMLPEIMIVSVAAGSYAPDIDNPRTHAGMKHKTASKIINKAGGGHRGITHTLLFPVIIGILCLFLNNYLASYAALQTVTLSILGGFELGWIMHIFADLFNGKGCPLFWPIVKSKVHIMDLPSTGAVPWWFAIVFAIAMFLVIGGGSF